jgi:hypothetical protein
MKRNRGKKKERKRKERGELRNKEEGDGEKKERQMCGQRREKGKSVA